MRIADRCDLRVFGARPEERHSKYVVRSKSTFPKKFPRPYLQRIGDVEEPFEEQATSAMFDIDKHISCDASLKRERLLGETALDPQTPDAGSDLPTPLLPHGHSLRIILAGSRGHAT